MAIRNFNYKTSYCMYTRYFPPLSTWLFFFRIFFSISVLFIFVAGRWKWISRVNHCKSVNVLMSCIPNSLRVHFLFVWLCLMNFNRSPWAIIIALLQWFFFSNWNNRAFACETNHKWDKCMLFANRNQIHLLLCFFN